MAQVFWIDQMLFVWYWHKYSTYLNDSVAFQYYNNCKKEYVSFLTDNMFQ